MAGYEEELAVHSLGSRGQTLVSFSSNKEALQFYVRKLINKTPFIEMNIVTDNR